MKRRHAAALALVGWYWMVPPTYIYPIHGNVLDPNNRVVVNLNAPLTWWFNWGEYDSRSACEAKRANNIQEDTTLENGLEEFVEMDRHSLCVASDDPRLKEAK
jgi:hypothetical protein